jgi:hypothetical protein
LEVGKGRRLVERVVIAVECHDVEEAVPVFEAQCGVADALGATPCEIGEDPFDQPGVPIGTFVLVR